jgi:hypothetical protein
MRQITIHLQEELYNELEAASAVVRELGFGPEAWAQEAIESALASRRLPRVPVGSHGPRIGEAESDEAEPKCYPLHFKHFRRNISF